MDTVRRRVVVVLLLSIVHTLISDSRAVALQRPSLEEFEGQLAALREALEIPGMSAAIAERGQIIWARGWGVADRERAVPATPDTLYHLASVTKPYAATIVLQLSDEGKVDVNQPVSDFGLTIGGSESPVRVSHLLSHTSAAVPGTRFLYDGAAYGNLTRIVERVTGRSFSRELTDRIIRRLALTHTAPNPRRPERTRPPDVPPDHSFDDSELDRPTIDDRLAMGYRRDSAKGLVPMQHPSFLFASAGLVASATDVARFSVALDQGVLLKKATLASAWTPVLSPAGEEIPYGLGWFVQRVRGMKVVWHFGHGPESSSLVLKIPERELTLVVLANSEGLSRDRRLGESGDVRRSPVAELFFAWMTTFERYQQ